MIDPRTITLDIKGTVRQITESSPTVPVKIVYQGTSAQFANYYTNSGKPRMKRAYHPNPNPKTPAQRIQQTKLADAVAAWHLLSPQDKLAYQSRAKTRNLTVYMVFVSEFIKNHKPTTGTVWDSGNTTWDSGNTTWDNTQSTVWDSGATVWDLGNTTWDI